MKIGEKVLYQKVPYQILEKIEDEAYVQMENEDWVYKLQNIQTGEIMLVGGYKLENEGITHLKLIECKTSKVRQLNILYQEIGEIEKNLETFNIK